MFVSQDLVASHFGVQQFFLQQITWPIRWCYNILFPIMLVSHYLVFKHLGVPPLALANLLPPAHGIYRVENMLLNIWCLIMLVSR